MSAILAAGAAVLLLEGLLDRSWRRFTWPLVSIGLAADHALLAAAVGGGLAVTQWWPDRVDRYPVRLALARYWETVALMGTATLGVLEALEAAISPDALGQDLQGVLMRMVEGSAEPFRLFLEQYPVMEAHRVAQLIDRAWHDGLDPEAAFEEARGMRAALAEERRLELGKKPLYASVLPAALLFSLLLILLVPLGTELARTWLQL